jgi:Uma2 family endonuclease
MAHVAPAPDRLTSERYLTLVDQGVLQPDDRVELLEGVVVAMAPSNPAHASAITRAHRALHDALGRSAVIREQHPFVAGAFSVPEPDLAVVPGTEDDYDTRHPTAALVVLEVADTSLAQDRLTKAGLYAAAGVPDYLLVNLRDGVVEAYRTPNPTTRRYAELRVAGRGERVELTAFPGATLAVDDLLPRH